MWSLNRVLTFCFDAVFSLMDAWPGWLSLTALSGVSGIAALLAFKYTSNQAAIGRVRDEIKANLLALKLFKDELRVTLQSQGRLFWAAGRLFVLSLQPLAVMIVPMVLLLAQMALRYEWRPLAPGESTLLIAELRRGTPEKLDDVRLAVPDAVEVEAGPVRVYEAASPGSQERNELVWRLRPTAPGRHQLRMSHGNETVEKEIMVSTRPYARVSPVRAGASFFDKLVYPAERPADPAGVIQEIRADFPQGSTPVFGWNLHWIITYFVASIAIALVFKPILKVKL